jgi:mannose-6-phosphate isomerase-like protein (cupin superfamily)
VVFIDGEGFTSVAGETAALRAGEQVRWPKGVTHRLWTDGSTMQTLMLERHGSQPSR